MTARPSKSYEYLTHTADVGIRARGRSFADCLAALGDALTGILCDRGSIQERLEVRLTVEAADTESTVVEWLNEVNYQFEVEHMAFRRFEVSWDGERVKATGHGERFDVARHRAGAQVKAATYHGLEVTHGQGGWQTRVFLDI